MIFKFKKKKMNKLLTKFKYLKLQKHKEKKNRYHIKNVYFEHYKNNFIATNIASNIL